ncbi:MAG TPA: M48 family metallopeptidase, partial [Adhaeribacter sp.]|nr:M48 family metallopeptidase [Adhaeribacter sp.]
SLAKQIISDESIDPVKTVYAQRFFNNLSGETGQVKVLVIENSKTNAFAMPGGHIVVFKPIIEMSESYEEFAGLMAHENAHLVHRHSLRALFRNLSGYLFMSVLFSDVNGIMAVVAENAHSLKSLQFTRELEKEADLTGLDMLVDRGVDPDGMVRLFAALKKESGNNFFPEFLSTHPMLDERITYLKEEIATRNLSAQPTDSLQYYWQKLKE